MGGGKRWKKREKEGVVRKFVEVAIEAGLFYNRTGQIKIRETAEKILKNHAEWFVGQQRSKTALENKMSEIQQAEPTMVQRIQGEVLKEQSKQGQAIEKMQKRVANPPIVESRELTPKQEKFVMHYALNGNGVKAAIAAGYKEQSARQQASRLRTYPHVRAAVEKYREKLEKKYDEAIEQRGRKMLEEVENKSAKKASTGAAEQQSVKGITPTVYKWEEGELVEVPESQPEIPREEAEKKRSQPLIDAVKNRQEERKTELEMAGEAAKGFRLDDRERPESYGVGYDESVGCWRIWATYKTKEAADAAMELLLEI